VEWSLRPVGGLAVGDRNDVTHIIRTPWKDSFYLLRWKPAGSHGLELLTGEEKEFSLLKPGCHLDLEALSPRCHFGGLAALSHLCDTKTMGLLT
jgi:hypothetical protein